MSPTFVPLVIKNAALTLEEVLPQALAAPPKQTHYLMVSSLYRKMAIAELLSTADPSLFFQNLFRSGRAFLYFLQNAPDAEKMTSKSEPLFDAIACRDREGAVAIARSSRMTFAAGKEYEEDFFYIRFLLDRLLLGALSDSARQWLGPWAELAQDDFRLDLCSALALRDQAAFDAALEAAIARLLAQIEALRARDALPPDAAATTAHVSTEVLAWLELAEASGLAVARDHPLAPSLARQFHLLRHPPLEDWRNIEPRRSFERSRGRP